MAGLMGFHSSRKQCLILNVLPLHVLVLIVLVRKVIALVLVPTVFLIVLLLLPNVNVHRVILMVLMVVLKLLLVVVLAVTIQPILPHKTPSNALVEMKLPVLRTSSLTTVSGTLLQLQLPVPVRMALKLSLPALRSLLPAHSPSR